MGRSDIVSDTIAGRYRVVARIAAGGMGEVFRARDQVLGRPVAIKILPADLAVHPGFVERFRAEAQAAALLSHPNVVQVHDWGETAATYYMVMEYVRGRNLREILGARGSLAPRQAAEIVRQLLGALAAAHERGLVHRDVKPENVMVTVDGAVKVTDFGIARLADSGSTTGELLGTVAYVSPEQIRGETLDGRADLYSTGCMLYELLTGAPPFEGDVPSVLHRHLHERVPAPSGERPECGPDLDRIVLRATDPDPDRRHRSAAEMRADVETALPALEEAAPLAELAAELTSEVPAETMQTAVSHPKPPRRPRRVWLPLLALVLVAAGILGFLLRPVPLPEVAGLDEGAARDRLLGAGFGVDSRHVYADNAVGEVLASEPEAGALARRGRTVVLQVSRGPEVTDVPRVTGMSLEAARLAIGKAGLLEGDVIEQYARENPGTVLDQEPRGGKVRSQTPVNLTVSKGPELVEVPDVRSMPFEEAQVALQGAGFAVLRQDAFNEAPAGTVLDQTPKPGEQVEKGSQATLTVSQGPPPFPMPNVLGKPCTEAKSELESLGLDVRISSLSGACSTNKVLGQDPLPDATVRRGQEANLYVP